VHFVHHQQRLAKQFVIEHSQRVTARSTAIPQFVCRIYL